MYKATVFLHDSLQHNTHKSQFYEGTQVQVKLEVTITVLWRSSNAS